MKIERVELAATPDEPPALDIRQVTPAPAETEEIPDEPADEPAIPAPDADEPAEAEPPAAPVTFPAPDASDVALFHQSYAALVGEIALFPGLSQANFLISQLGELRKLIQGAIGAWQQTASIPDFTTTKNLYSGLGMTNEAQRLATSGGYYGLVGLQEDGTPRYDVIAAKVTPQASDVRAIRAAWRERLRQHSEPLVLQLKDSFGTSFARRLERALAAVLKDE